MPEGAAVQYAKSGDVEIAWTIIGDGPLDLVYIPGFISHLDLAPELPAFAALFGRLGRIGRVLTFDKRGTGLSGRDLGFGSLAERADDIRVVMDAAGWKHAHLFAVSEAGPLSIVFAATYPDRVERLVLYGSFASSRPEDLGLTAEEMEWFLDWEEQHWGSGRVMGPFIDAPDDEPTRQLVGRYERACATPRLAADIDRLNFQIDVRPLLPTVHAPALVLHRTQDPMIE